VRALRIILAAVSLLLSGTGAAAQIVNRLRVDQATWQTYAGCRMQPFSESNLRIADSLCREGQLRDNWKLRCLGLSLEFPVRFAQGDYAAMDAAVAEIKALTADRKEARPFCLEAMHEHCEFLVRLGRSSDAMLEARAMERLAVGSVQPLGRMFAYRIIGLIHSYRSNSYLAIRNYEKAAKYSKEASQEQNLPNLYLLIAQEYIKMHDFEAAENWCSQAEPYIRFFPSLERKILMTRATGYFARGDHDAFRECYATLMADPVYSLQEDRDRRCMMDIYYSLTCSRFDDALSQADLLSTPIDRSDVKHGIYAAKGDFPGAYGELRLLMTEKDSVYIKVQNEDLAILDAEMNNAQLREEAQRLEARNRMTIMAGFLVMFVIAFLAILLSQWQLRQNLDEMRRANSQALAARQAFQKAMDAKEAENSYKIKILQNRTTNVLSNYEDILNL